MKTSLVVLSLLMAFVMLISGCTGNSDKPSDPSSQITSSETVSSITTSETASSYKVIMGENALSCVVEPKKVTEYDTYEFVGNDKQNDRNYLLTINVPKGLKSYPPSRNLGLGGVADFSEVLTYTEKTNYFCELQVKPATDKTMDEMLENAKHNYEMSDRLYYKLYDNGIIEKKEPGIDWMVETTRYFDCGYTLTAFFSNECGYEKMIYDMLSSATLVITDREASDIKQITGTEARLGTPSEKYNEYKFTCKNPISNEEYHVSFEIPEGVGYDVNKWGEPKTAEKVCSIYLIDGTGYSTSGYTFSFPRIERFSSEKHDLTDTEKYTEIEDGIYTYAYTPEISSGYALRKRVYFRVINEDYMVCVEEVDEDYYNDVSELERRLTFDFFKTVKVSKK